MLPLSGIFFSNLFCFFSFFISDDLLQCRHDIVLMSYYMHEDILNVQCNAHEDKFDDWTLLSSQEKLCESLILFHVSKDRFHFGAPFFLQSLSLLSSQSGTHLLFQIITGISSYACSSLSMRVRRVDFFPSPV